MDVATVEPPSRVRPSVRVARALLKRPDRLLLLPAPTVATTTVSVPPFEIMVRSPVLA